MSIIISNNEEVLRDPGNLSPSKAQYSFEKEPRFDRSYNWYNNNKNKNLCYFEGMNAKNLSTLSKQSGKFSQAPRLNNIFCEINRH